MRKLKIKLALFLLKLCSGWLKYLPSGLKNTVRMIGLKILKNGLNSSMPYKDTSGSGKQGKLTPTQVNHTSPTQSLGSLSSWHLNLEDLEQTTGQSSPNVTKIRDNTNTNTAVFKIEDFVICGFFKDNEVQEAFGSICTILKNDSTGEYLYVIKLQEDEGYVTARKELVKKSSRC